MAAWLAGGTYSLSLFPPTCGGEWETVSRGASKGEFWQQSVCGRSDYCAELILSPCNGPAAPWPCDSAVPPDGWTPYSPVDSGLDSVILWSVECSRSTWAKCLNVLAWCYLVSLHCHLPWAQPISVSMVAAGPRVKDGWSILAPACSLYSVIQHTWTLVSDK